MQNAKDLLCRYVYEPKGYITVDMEVGKGIEEFHPELLQPLGVPSSHVMKLLS